MSEYSRSEYRLSLGTVYSNSYLNNLSLQMMNDQFTISPSAPVVITYNIDDGIGRDTAISAISKFVSNLGIDVSGPPNVTLSKSADQVESLSLLIPGISEVGYNI